MKDLHQAGLRGRLPFLIEGFLKNRQFSVRSGACLTGLFDQEMGVPQGSVLSVTLVALKINSIVKAISPGVECSLYVDDFLIVYRFITLLSAIYSALFTCYHTGLTLMASNSQAAKQCVCISADFAVIIQIQNLRSMVLSSLLLNKPNSSESFLTISSHSFHTFVTLKKSVWRRWTFYVLLLTLPGEPTSTRCYIFIDRLFVLSSTMAALSMVLPENLTYVYWIRYRTIAHCGYASVPSELHLPQVCVFKPMNLHSTYGEECWAYSIPSDLARPRAVRLTIRSSAQNSKLPFL